MVIACERTYDLRTVQATFPNTMSLGFCFIKVKLLFNGHEIYLYVVIEVICFLVYQCHYD